MDTDGRRLFGKSCWPIPGAIRRLALLLLLVLSFATQAQYSYTTNNGAITITGYSGPGGEVNIPAAIDGWPVTGIGTAAFQQSGLTSITIPDSVTNIGPSAFAFCTSLTNGVIGNGVSRIREYTFEYSSLNNITIGTSVTNIGTDAFSYCVALTDIVLPDRLNRIESGAFSFCYGLGTITIPDSVTSIGYAAFSHSSPSIVVVGRGVTNIEDYAFNAGPPVRTYYFKGNAPHFGPNTFDSITRYYLPGTTGWGLGGLYGLLWNPKLQTGDGSFGVRSNRFGFNLTGTSGLVVNLQSCTNLSNPIWKTVQVVTLTGNPVYFSDAPGIGAGRFYRIWSP